MSNEKDGTIFDPQVFGLGAVSRSLPGFPDPTPFTGFQQGKVRKKIKKIVQTEAKNVKK